ncbi:otoancorin [Hoplias malabaricus]|uniref:otoancorin n=1 Tax=Hoplias malabaricus TaxID=27720 RepID=UPI003462F84A
MSPAGRGLIVFFVVQWFTVKSQDVIPPPSMDHMTFPFLPQDFMEIAKKLMIKCLNNGYAPPNMTDFLFNSSAIKPEEKMHFIFPFLLSSFLPLPGNQPTVKPNMTGPIQQDIFMNITEMWNCTALSKMIELMRNTTEKDYCFMRAFMAPLSWAAVMQNSSQLSAEKMKMLLWAAKPFLEAMPPSPLAPPFKLDKTHLVEMMKMFNEVFSSLSEDQKDEIIRWMKDRVVENEPACPPNQNLSSIPLPKPPMPSVSTKPEHVTVSPRLTNSTSSGCPKMPWLKADALKMMGRFFSRLSETELRAIPKEEMCKFFIAPEFPSSFNKSDRLQTAIGRMLMQRLMQECLNGKQIFLSLLDRLGSLACFFDDISSLNVTLSMKLLSQLGECENNRIDQMKRDLVRKVMEENAPPSLELLRSLGSGVTVLPPSKLSDFSSEALSNILSSLKQAVWKPAQAKILAQKLLEKVKDINGDSLLSLGSLVRGVDSDILRKLKLQGLLGNESLKNITEKMSSLQKKALLEALRSSVNDSDLVKGVPDPLLPFLPLSILEKAGIRSIDQLGNRSWTQTQSVYLLKKILNQGINSEQLKKLGLAVQGVTCSMVDSINQNYTLESMQTLANSSNWLSRTQVHCAAQRLFQNLEKQRAGYFVNISDSELQAIPALLLIHLPIKSIQGLPARVCPRFLEKMSQANLSSLPNSAPSRWELRDKALRCLGKNASDLSTAEILCLGSLVCELDPVWMASLNPAVLNSTLQALASCVHIPRVYRASLFSLITKVYGCGYFSHYGVWLTLLVIMDWLKSFLSDLLDRVQSQSESSVPPEFHSWPDLQTLHQKLFQLKTKLVQQRRRRAVPQAVPPSQSVIEDLGEGNVYWSPAQIANISTETFRKSVHVLGEVRNYTAEQLAALREKVIEAFGDVSLLNQAQIVELGCITQSFNSKELETLNITTLDTLELLSVCQWNSTQTAIILQGFLARTGMKMSKLGAVEMVGLGQFICGLQPAQIDQLNATEFKEAVEDIGHAKCPLTILECLKNKAISVFGETKSWSEVEVSMMGNIIAGLNGTELASLNSSVLPFIRQFAIPLIPPERLAMMSVNQLKSFGPDNAAVVTDMQRLRLSWEQRAALNETLGLPTSRTETITITPTVMPQKGGASEQSLLGIALLPVVLLLLGFIL